MMRDKKFLDDVIKGLQSKQKYLYSKYLYNAEGDKLFEGIMRSSDYYLTNCELEIFEQQKSVIADVVAERGEFLDIIALGPGDSSKTIYLIEELYHRDAVKKYFPIDISKHIIESLAPVFAEKFPKIAFHGLAGEYFDKLPEVLRVSKNKRLVFFVGATIGNFLPDQMLAFCRRLRVNLQPGDIVLIGFDLKKDPRKILAAYNDSEGWTRKFNLNLLTRINRELGADFNIEEFAHFPTYDPLSGACRSFLISLTEQQVGVDGYTVHFKKGEPVYMEVSQKYDIEEIEQAAHTTGFEQIAAFMDSKNYFVDVLWKVG